MTTAASFSTDLRPVSLPAPGSEEAAAMAPLCAVFRRHLRSLNLKYTTERADILDAIIAIDDAFEADQLRATMREAGHRVSKATVYRTIHLLLDAGIITQILSGDRQTHYRLAYGTVAQDDIVCLRSGRRERVDDAELRAVVARICRERGWSPVGHRLEIYGIAPGDADVTRPSRPAGG